MGIYLSAFVKSPEEYGNAARALRNERYEQGLPRWLLPPRVQGQILVQWAQAPNDFRIYDIANVPLTSSGGLDLRLVNKIWGFDKCNVIDPIRLTMFESKDPFTLSPLAVRSLVDKTGGLRIVERRTPISEEKRRIRKKALELVSSPPFRDAVWCATLYAILCAFILFMRLVCPGAWAGWFDGTTDGGVSRTGRSVQPRP